MEAELAMIKKNCTWDLVDRPIDRKVIGVKWVYITKLNAHGSVNKLKVMLIPKGFSQQYGVDYVKPFHQ